VSPQAKPDADQPDSAVGERVSFLQAMLSVIQASFGVQSSQNRERDFTKGKLWIFIVSALIFTVVFVLAIAGIVSMVLPD
jgi:hypothetical protein